MADADALHAYNAPHVEHLLRLRDHGVLAGLIGAGSSMACGYPGWGGFLGALERHLVGTLHPDYLERLRRRDVRTRADEYAQHLGDEYRRIFLKTFEPREAGAPLPAWIARLFDLDFRIILTTNYTTELEQAARAHPARPLGPDPKPVRWHDDDGFDRALRRLAGRLELVYLHGRYDDPIERVVLGEKSYQAAYESPAVLHERVKAVCLTSTLLLIGSSLQDDDMMGVLRFTKALARGRSPHYAVLGLLPGQKPASVGDDLLARFGVQPIFYPVLVRDGREDHSALDALLQQLTRRAARAEPDTDRRAPEPPASGVFREQPYSFTARPTISNLLDAALAPGGGASLIALAGPGGAGKTTLAADYARRHAADFGLIAWIDVRERGASHERVLAALLEELGDGPRAPRTPEEEFARAITLLRARAIRSARTLLIFDNVDQLGDALRDLLDALARTPRCHVLVTTRKADFAAALRAKQIDVGAFRAEEAVRFLRTWLAGDPRADDEAGLRRIARHERYLPLWLELAASHLHRTGVDLRTYLRGGGVFDQIWAELDEPTQALFIACGACAAIGFHADAVAGALGVEAGRARSGLDELVSRALVSRRADGSNELHPILRKRARSLPRFAELAARHAGWVLSSMGTDLRDMSAVAAVQQELAAAIGNVQEIDDAEKLVALCRRAWWFWRNRGPLAWAEACLRVATQKAAARGDVDGQRALLWARASILAVATRRTEALEDLLALEKLCPAAGSLRIRVINKSAALLGQLGRAEAARERLLEALRLEEAHGGSTHELAVTLHELGVLEQQANHHDAALAYYDQSLSLSRDARDDAERASTMTNIALIHLARGAAGEALRLLGEAEGIYRRLNRTSDLITVLTIRALHHAAAGQLDEAEAACEESIELARATGNTSREHESVRLLATLRTRQGRAEETRALIERALALSPHHAPDAGILRLWDAMYRERDRAEERKPPGRTTGAKRTPPAKPKPRAKPTHPGKGTPPAKQRRPSDPNA